MSKKSKFIIGGLLLLFGMLVYLETTEKEDVNWFPSYHRKHKIPYGTFILHEQLKASWGEEEVIAIDRPPYEVLGDSLSKGSYFFINSSINLDAAEVDRLLEWTAEGNTLFLAGSAISEALLDTLHLSTEYYYDLNTLNRNPYFELYNPAATTDAPYTLNREASNTYFETIDTLETSVLGAFDTSLNDDGKLESPQVHFISKPFGAGEVIIHLMPATLTNFAFLQDKNATYIADVLAYLPRDRPIFWDSHYKNGKDVASSPLYIFLKNRYLKWAYYMLIIGVLLWVFFEGKRKQRPVPIILPRPNKTLDYTKTIAGMYLDRMDHESIARHQINHFLEHLRSHYLVNTQQLDEAFYQRVSQKTNNTLEDTKQLFNVISTIRNPKRNSPVSKELLMRLNRLIETYTHTTKTESHGR